MRLRGTPRGADCERPLGACPIRPQLLLRASRTDSCADITALMSDPLDPCMSMALCMGRQREY